MLQVKEAVMHIESLWGPSRDAALVSNRAVMPGATPTLPGLVTPSAKQSTAQQRPAPGAGDMGDNIGGNSRMGDLVWVRSRRRVGWQ